MAKADSKSTKPKTKHSPTDGPNVKGGSEDARRVAALVLEVLAGMIRPSDAARLLKVSLPRYYQVELRALEGLVKACEPAPKGPKQDIQKEVQKLERKVSRLENDCVRFQSLARAAGRTVGLPATREDKKADKGKVKRKPTIRALKVAKGLKTDSAKGVK
jgi:outer membrane murein-binding lipoprotein Lpp